MSTIINTNLSALNAHRNMKSVGTKQAKASEKLSSGLRINSAADDAAGLAISEKMKAQIRGLKTAERNVEDGISLIQTAEGGMNQISEMVIRQRELVIQAMNDTNTSEDRANIQVEIDQLTAEIDSMAEKTEFNTIPLLNVPYAAPSTSTPSGSMGSGILDTTDIHPINSSITATQTSSSSELVNGVPTPVDHWELTGGSVGAAPSRTDVAEINTNSANLTILVSDYTPPRNAAQWPDLDLILVDNDTGSQTVYGYDGQLGGGGGTVNVPGGGTISYTGIGGNPEQFNIQGLPTNYSIIIYIRNGGSNQAHSFTIQVSTPAIDFSNGQVPPTQPASSPLWIQSGANSNQGIYIDRYDCRAASLGIKPIIVDPLAAAEASLVQLDNSLNRLNGYRANCGAQQNRLDYIKSSLVITLTNLEDANSRIADADMAKEMMELTKANVLQEASTSMLAQANQQPQTVLQLIKQ